MEKSQKINTLACSFKSAAPYLKKSLGGDGQLLRLECENNISNCWRFNDGEAHMLTRAEGLELVVCCFEGKSLQSFVSHIFKAAKACGFTSIRFHTKRPGILKLLNQKFHLVKYTGVEYIYRSLV